MTLRALLLAFGLASASPALAADGLRVALDGTFAPHAMPSLSGGVEGFNVDLAHAIAEKLGTTVTVDATQFAGLIPALQAGTYDFLVAPVTVTKERAANLLFTEGFMDSNYRFIQRAGTEAPADLEGYRGKVLAVNKGSINDIYLEERAAQYGYELVSFGTLTDAIAAVISGRAYAAFGGETTVAWAVKKNPKLELGFVVPTGLVGSLSFRKDDIANRDKVDAVLECLKSDGTMQKLAEKWLGYTPTAGDTMITPTPGYGVPGYEGYEDKPHEVSCSF